MTPAERSVAGERIVRLLPVLLVAVAVRAALLWFYERSDLASCLGMDPSYFYTSAIRIYHGELTQGHGLFVGGPLYPYFLAMLMKLVGVDYLRLRLIQGAIGIATALLIAWLGERLYSRRVGVAAGVASSFCGPLVLGELGFENEFLVTFFTLAALALLVACRRSRGAIFGSGLLLGLAALTRGNQLFAVGLTILWLLATMGGWRRGLADSALLVAGVCLAIAPVTIRNYRQYHEFIAISAHGGYVFYLGNSPQAIYRYRALSFGD
ncbi:MAG TPA: glycosyltransferase family 39 protein, partial [Geobacteraceae bacterium]